MKKAIFILLLVSTYTFSQNQANIWYFGQNAGLDFNSGKPVDNSFQEAFNEYARKSGEISFKPIAEPTSIAKTAPFTDLPEFSPSLFDDAGGGTTVLGHYSAYTKLASKLGANRFQIPTNVWNKMTAAVQWAANTKFLDRIILRGDNIYQSFQVCLMRLQVMDLISKIIFQHFSKLSILHNVNYITK